MDVVEAAGAQAVTGQRSKVLGIRGVGLRVAVLVPLRNYGIGFSGGFYGSIRGILRTHVPVVVCQTDLSNEVLGIRSFQM